MHKKRILIIQPILPRYRISFFIELADLFGDITILHFANSQLIFENKKIKVINGTIRSIRGIRYIVGLKQLLREYDVIIAVFDPHWLNVFFLPFYKGDSRLIFWGHGFGRSNILNNIRLMLLKRADALIVYDDSGKDRITKKDGTLSDKIFVAPNTISVSNFQDTTECSKNSFLYVGRLQKRKKIDVLLKAFAKLNLKDEGFVINIIGDGDEEKAFLKEVSRDLKIQNFVNFIEGTTEEAILLKYFQSAYAYVSPGDVGLGVLHSFAYGVPVVTMVSENHGPEFNNIINSENGLIAASFEEICESLLIVTRGNAYKKMGTNAFSHYTQKRQLSHMIQGFKSALDFVK